jgi:hypothetical protein
VLIVSFSFGGEWLSLFVQVLGSGFTLPVLVTLEVFFEELFCLESLVGLIESCSRSAFFSCFPKLEISMSFLNSGNTERVNVQSTAFLVANFRVSSLCFATERISKSERSSI